MGLLHRFHGSFDVLVNVHEGWQWSRSYGMVSNQYLVGILRSSPHAARVHSILTSSSDGCSQEPVMLNMAVASRFPTGECPSGRRFNCPSNGKIRMAEWGEGVAAACLTARSSISRSLRATY